MKYKFAHNISLVEAREAIRIQNEIIGTKAFIESDRGDHVVLNYIISTALSWPDPMEDGISILESRRRTIVRECRGIAFDKETGHVISRSLHKFYNLFEKAETQADAISWNTPHTVLTKADGSMIRTINSRSGIVLGTRMGKTEIADWAQEFVDLHENYQVFIKDMVAQNKTAIFEFCSKRQKIVLDYPVERLILTNIRDNDTGEYVHDLSVFKSYGLDIIDTYDHSTKELDKFIAHVKALANEEGYILAFETGHKLKLKSDWYGLIHSTKDGLRHEKDVLALIFSESYDDTLSILAKEDRAAVELFKNIIESNLINYAKNLALRVEQDRLEIINDSNYQLVDDKDNFVKKQFAVVYAKKYPKIEHGLAFAILSGQDSYTSVIKLISKYFSTSTKVEDIRFMLGTTSWTNLYNVGDLDV